MGSFKPTAHFTFHDRAGCSPPEWSLKLCKMSHPALFFFFNVVLAVLGLYNWFFTKMYGHL
jgi:hypothetical protein